VAAIPQRIVWIASFALLVAAAAGAYAVRHLHDDARRNAGRLMGCPPTEVEVEQLDGDPPRYRVAGCDGGGIMTCPPDGPLCFIVPEESWPPS
jgi:hypothetical protein